jgi:ataxia telangiectasia mutated family protein
MLVQCTCHKCPWYTHTDYCILHWLVFDVVHFFLHRSGTMCFLVHKYGYRVDKSSLISWFVSSCKSLKR